MSGTAKTELGKADRARREDLSEEERFLRRSLEDLDREHAAGDLDTADYEALRANYEARSRAIDDALAELETPGPTAQPPTRVALERPAGARGWLSSRRHRLVLGWSAVACFAVAGTLVGLALAGVAPFAQQQPLSVATQIRIELGEAGTLAQHHDIVQAVAVYDKVLELDPGQPEALADGGWLVRLAGVSSGSARLINGGDAEIAAAVKAAPGYALARAYDGVALYQDEHSAAAAVREFAAMLADRPSNELLFSVKVPALAAYRAAGVVGPSAVVSATPPRTAPAKAP